MLDAPKWVMLYCAIEPSIRRKKLGEFLCQPVLEMADFQQQECYSWLMEENAVTFMQKLHFDISGPFQSKEEKELVYYLCLRKPKTMEKKSE